MDQQKPTFNDLPDFVHSLAQKIDTALEILTELTQKKPSTKFVDVERASQITGLAKQTIYTKTSKNTIPHHKSADGRKIYFVESELEDYMSGNWKPENL